MIKLNRFNFNIEAENFLGIPKAKVKIKGLTIIPKSPISKNFLLINIFAITAFIINHQNKKNFHELLNSFRKKINERFHFFLTNNTILHFQDILITSEATRKKMTVLSSENHNQLYVSSNNEKQKRFLYKNLSWNQTLTRITTDFFNETGARCLVLESPTKGLLPEQIIDFIFLIKKNINNDSDAAVVIINDQEQFS